VPAYLGFVAHGRPHVLKAFRHRLEHALKDGMPAQMLPYLQLHWNTIRGFPEGIREAAMIGRGLGMSRAHLLDAIAGALTFGGSASVAIAAEATAGVL
jgi:hypothetical protein